MPWTFQKKAEAETGGWTKQGYSIVIEEMTREMARVALSFLLLVCAI